MMTTHQFRAAPFVLLTAFAVLAASACSNDPDGVVMDVDGSGGSLVVAASGGVSSGGATTSSGGALAGTGGTGSGGDGLSTGGTTGVPSGGASGSGGGMSGGSPGAGGSGAGGTDGSGGDGAMGYQACPSSPCKIMPFGDSITFGVGDEGNGGYRGPLFGLTVAEGQKVTFTGSISNGPTTVSGQTFPKKNEGHSGWGIAQVTQYSGNNAGIITVLPNPGFSSGSGGIPDIVLLHIGTNDQGTLSAAQMTSDLVKLLDKISAEAPDALVVVAQIIPLGYGNNEVIKTYNQSIPGLVQERANAGKHIMLVDMFTGYDAKTMIGSDAVHPNTAGYKFMADHWYSVIGEFLPN